MLWNALWAQRSREAGSFRWSSTRFSGYMPRSCRRAPTLTTARHRRSSDRLAAMMCKAVAGRMLVPPPVDFMTTLPIASQCLQRRLWRRPIEKSYDSCQSVSDFGNTCLSLRSLPPVSKLIRVHSVDIKTPRNRLSEYIRAASAGQTVLISDRGRVVAELVSPRMCVDTPPDERVLGDPLRQGLLAPAKVPCKTRPLRRRPVTQINAVLCELDASRADR